MTAKTRSAIKLLFEQGDKPQGSDYEDLIDSYLSVADTTAQSLSSPLTVTGALGASTTVSANSIEASAATITTYSGTDMTLTGTVSASTANFGTLIVGGTPVAPSTLAAKADVYIEATALATCSSTAAYVSVAVSASSRVTPVDFSAASTRVAIEYTGSSEKVFEVHGMISAKMNAGSNQDVRFALIKNGALLAGTDITRRISGTTDFGAIAIGGLVKMSATDTISIGIRNVTSTNNVDIASCILFISEA